MFLCLKRIWHFYEWKSEWNAQDTDQILNISLSRTVIIFYTY